MGPEKITGDNSSITPSEESGISESLVKNPGVISGETSDKPSEIQQRQERRFEALKSLEEQYADDGEISRLLEETKDEGSPLHQMEALLDGLRKLRLDLDASDADPKFKKTRANQLSDLMNRLRELI